MRRLLISNVGMSHIKTAVLILVAAIVFSAVFLYSSIMTIIQASRDQTKRVLDDFVMHNSIIIYDALKNGDDLSEELDELFYKSEFFAAYSLDISGDSLYSVSDQGGVEYALDAI